MSLLLVALFVSCASGSDTTDYSVHVRHLINMSYELDIIRNADQSVVQTISLRNSVDPSEPGHIEVIDLNRDGYGDLRIYGGRSEEGNWNKIWIFDPASEQFIFSHTTEPGRGS